VPVDRKVFITPMQGALRVAGTVEFRGLEHAPNEARAQLYENRVAAFLQARREGPRASGWAITPACRIRCR
jgi:hypothetical protein